MKKVLLICLGLAVLFFMIVTRQLQRGLSAKEHA